MGIRYGNVCIWCGKSGGANYSGGSGGGTPSSTPPQIPGKCPSSPDGKHKPRWEMK